MKVRIIGHPFVYDLYNPIDATNFLQMLKADFWKGCEEVRIFECEQKHKHTFQCIECKDFVSTDSLKGWL